MKYQVSTPHDSFVKASLKDIDIARDFLREHLSQDLLARIDFASLRLTDKEFVLPEMRKLHSDVIYQCLIDGQAAYIYFLIEHQSSPEALMPFRKLQYKVSLMSDHLKQGHDKLPVIISFCLYHGKSSPYPYTTDIVDCFANPALAKDYGISHFHLIDLTIIDDDTIEGHGMVGLMELLLKHHRDKKLLRRLKQLQDSGRLRQWFVQYKSSEYLLRVLEYILATGNDETATADEVIDVFQQALPEQGEKFMTFAQQLREEGMQKGIQQGIEQGMQKGMEKGMEKGMRQVAENMLNHGYSPNKASKLSGLSLEEVEQLRRSLAQAKS